MRISKHVNIMWRHDFFLPKFPKRFPKWIGTHLQRHCISSNPKRFEQFLPFSIELEINCCNRDVLWEYFVANPEDIILSEKKKKKTHSKKKAKSGKNCRSFFFPHIQHQRITRNSLHRWNQQRLDIEIRSNLFLSVFQTFFDIITLSQSFD